MGAHLGRVLLVSVCSRRLTMAGLAGRAIMKFYFILIFRSLKFIVRTRRLYTQNRCKVQQMIATIAGRPVKEPHFAV